MDRRMVKFVVTSVFLKSRLTLDQKRLLHLGDFIRLCAESSMISFASPFTHAHQTPVSPSFTAAMSRSATVVRHSIASAFNSSSRVCCAGLSDVSAFTSAKALS